MGSDDPVTRVGNKVWGEEKGCGGGEVSELLWIKNERGSHVIVSGTFLIYSHTKMMHLTRRRLATSLDATDAASGVAVALFPRLKAQIREASRMTRLQIDLTLSLRLQL